ncbi:hypothetical protein HYZ41_03950 [archaeon]|nr:hypothetical protein [archaeon]
MGRERCLRKTRRKATQKAGKEDFGAIIGKAMESCDKEEHEISVLASLR